MNFYVNFRLKKNSDTCSGVLKEVGCATFLTQGDIIVADLATGQTLCVMEC